MTNLRRFLLGILIAASLGGAALAQTANLGMTKPTVGADADAWGGEINADLDLIDAFAKRSTRQVLTSGSSATYTTASGARQLRIRMIGAGGGGASSSNNLANGNVGGDTIFNSVHAVGGGAGAFSGSPAYSTTPGTGSASSRTIGNAGSPGITIISGSTTAYGGSGGGSQFGGGAGSGTAAPNNSGAGGGGAIASGFNGNSGSGGQAGEYVELIINSPSASYTFSVGTGGAAGTGGGAGGSGVIIVDEIY